MADELMDLVITPKHSFAMLDIKGVEKGTLLWQFYAGGKTAIPTTPLSAGVLPHISEMAAKYPDAPIDAFFDNYSGLQIKVGTFGELLSDGNMIKLATVYRAKLGRIAQSMQNPNLRPTMSAAVSYIKQEFPLTIWSQLVKTQGLEFLKYDFESLSAVKLTDSDFRLADSIGMGNNGHGDFTITVYGIQGKFERGGKIYRRDTLELRLKDVVKGQGIDAFNRKF